MSWKNRCDFDAVDAMHWLTAHEKAIRYYIKPKCEVEAERMHQGGVVEKVFRNRQGVPVCVKVRDHEGVDYIEMSEITFYEPWDRTCWGTAEQEFESFHCPDDDEEDEDWNKEEDDE